MCRQDLGPEVLSHKCLWLDVLENIQHQCHFPASADQNSFREDTNLGLYVQVSHCLYLFLLFIVRWRDSSKHMGTDSPMHRSLYRKAYGGAF